MFSVTLLGAECSGDLEVATDLSNSIGATGAC